MPWGVAKVPVQAVMQTARSEKRCTLLLALLIHFISGIRMIRKDLFVLIPGQAGIWTTLSPFGAAVQRLWLCCLEDGDLLGVKQLCCSLPVHALGVWV